MDYVCIEVGIMTVTLPWDHDCVDKALEWAKENCPSYITHLVGPDYGIVYYFSDEKDAVLFALRWL